MGMVATFAYADTISPTSYATDLALGESVTITKTVTVTRAAPTTAPLDVMFVFDTTGSMGAALAGAKSAANSILAGLAGFGSLTSGSAFYNDPGHGITQNLTATSALTTAAINTYSAGGGGDYPELGWAGIGGAADNATWRAGSNRFIIAFGDAPFKDGEGYTSTSSRAAVAAKGAKVIGLNYGSDGLFAADINSFAGGSAVAGSTDPATIVSTILASITSSFASYSTVAVDDLGTGDPEIAVSSVCLTADIGTCSGALATGTYDRSIDRTFTFATTFTRTASGDKSFETYALVDGKIVATEADRIGEAPEPGTLALVGVSLLGLVAARRRVAA
jgi:hypothetical protein